MHKNRAFIRTQKPFDFMAMQRVSAEYSIENISLFKTQVLNWAQQYETVVWLDSNAHDQKYSQYEAILAIDANSALKSDYHNAFEKLKAYQKETADYIFGCLGYDLKK